MLAKSDCGLQHGAPVRECRGLAEHQKQATGVAMLVHTAQILRDAQPHAVYGAGPIVLSSTHLTEAKRCHIGCPHINLLC